jgi:two-component system alkaline phosphatase synthesis response regulator PhoP
MTMDIRKEILEVLKESPEGMSTRQLSVKTRHGRATLGKYLELLQMEGKVKCSVVGASKIWRPGKAARKKRILIIEDDSDYIRLLEIVLSSPDYGFIGAKNGEEGLEHVKDMPDLVILDVMLPGMDGFKVCERIKENTLTKDIPVIMLTAKGELEDRLNGLKHGADDYLPKPFRIDDLRSRVKSLIMRTRERNPITNLPGKEITLSAIQSAGKNNSVIVITFTNMGTCKKNLAKKEYHECIRLAAQTISHELSKANDTGFIGHVGDNIFLVICRKEKVEYIIKQLKKDLSKVVPLMFRSSVKSLRFKTEVSDIREFNLDKVSW